MQFRLNLTTLHLVVKVEAIKGAHRLNTKQEKDWCRTGHLAILDQISHLYLREDSDKIRKTYTLQKSFDIMLPNRKEWVKVIPIRINWYNIRCQGTVEKRLPRQAHLHTNWQQSCIKFTWNQIEINYRLHSCTEYTRKPEYGKTSVNTRSLWNPRKPGSRYACKRS